MKHRDFVYAGEVFRITEDEERGITTDWSGALALAAALRTLWSVAEERDKLRVEVAATRENAALLDENARLRIGARNKDGEIDRLLAVREDLAAKSKRRKAKIRKLKKRLARLIVAGGVWC